MHICTSLGINQHVLVSYLSTGEEKPQTDPDGGRSAVTDTAMLWRARGHIVDVCDWSDSVQFYQRISGTTPSYRLPRTYDGPAPCTDYSLYPAYIPTPSATEAPAPAPTAASAHLGETKHRKGWRL